jgi:pimeloyl-ACP methyl ester carboxylesterase
MVLRPSLLCLCCSLGFLLLAGSRANAQVGLGFFHPLQACDPKVVSNCETAPSDGKEHVYTFIVNGLDPLQLANLNGMTSYVRRLGFSQTHFEPLLGYRATARHIRAIRQSDPDAKIVLVGYSVGSLVVRRLANELERENIVVDRLVYLGGDFIGNTQQSRPSNVAKVVNIRGHGSMFSGYDLFFKGADIDNAVNVRLDSRHFVLPSRGQTMETLASELANLAQDSHAAIAARTLKESPTADQPENQIAEKSPLEVHPVSLSRQTTAPDSKP